MERESGVCWSSLWTARAIGYRARNGISNDDVALAIVVQVMVPSEASGVLFTANPLNGKRSEMVIDATRPEGWEAERVSLPESALETARRLLDGGR